MPLGKIKAKFLPFGRTYCQRKFCEDFLKKILPMVSEDLSALEVLTGLLSISPFFKD